MPRDPFGRHGACTLHRLMDSMKTLRAMQLLWIALAVGSATSASAFDYELSGVLQLQGMDFIGAYRYVAPVETTSLAASS